MDVIVATPTPQGPNAARKALEEHHIQFEGFIFEIIVFSDQDISVSFNEISTSKIHEANNIRLQNINNKTVLAALKKEHVDVIGASLKYVEEKYSLNVEVKYDFLPPIVEHIAFAPKTISDKDMSDLEIKNYFHEIKLLKEEVSNVSNCDVTQVKLEGKPAEAKITIPKYDTLVTWSIEATSGLSNNVRLNVDYLNSRSGETKPTKFVPNEMISCHATSGFGTIETRFLIKPVEGFDQVVFKFGQNCQGKMLIVKERV